MNASRKRFPCPLCKESFLFEKTHQFHMMKVHNRPTFSLAISGLEDSLADKTGQSISVSLSIGGDSTKGVITTALKPEGSKTTTPRKLKKKLSSAFKGCGRIRKKKCNNCSFQTDKITLMLAHETLEHRVKALPVFYCGYPECWFPFSSNKEKCDHEKVKHGEILSNPFSCVICKKRFPKSNKFYENHLEKCVKRTRYKCPCSQSCHYIFWKRSTVINHVQKIHKQSLSNFEESSYVIKPNCDDSQEETDDDVMMKQEVVDDIDLDVDPVLDPQRLVGVVEIKEEVLDEVSNSEEREYYQVESDSVVNEEKFECPFDGRKFRCLPDLHKHVHHSHLDTGFDSLDCPFCEDFFRCFCGRETNNRDSLVLHSLRCSQILSLTDTAGHCSEEVSPVAGSTVGQLTARRRAARKLKEMGYKEKLSYKDKIRIDQMKMCEFIALYKSQEQSVVNEESSQNHDSPDSGDSENNEDEEDEEGNNDDILMQTSAMLLNTSKRKKHSMSGGGPTAKKSCNEEDIVIEIFSSNSNSPAVIIEDDSSCDNNDLACL